jgi:hypothetical protein
MYLFVQYLLLLIYLIGGRDLNDLLSCGYIYSVQISTGEKLQVCSSYDNIAFI